MRQRPTGQLGCGQQSGNRPPAGCMNKLSHHPSAAQDLTFHDKPGSNSIGYCPLYRQPNGLHGLIDVDADAATREWLLSKLPEI